LWCEQIAYTLNYCKQYDKLNYENFTSVEVMQNGIHNINELKRLTEYKDLIFQNPTLEVTLLEVLVVHRLKVLSDKSK